MFAYTYTIFDIAKTCSVLLDMGHRFHVAVSYGGTARQVRLLWCLIERMFLLSHPKPSTARKFACARPSLPLTQSGQLS